MSEMKWMTHKECRNFCAKSENLDKHLTFVCNKSDVCSPPLSSHMILNNLALTVLDFVEDLSYRRG